MTSTMAVVRRWSGLQPTTSSSRCGAWHCTYCSNAASVYQQSEHISIQCLGDQLHRAFAANNLLTILLAVQSYGQAEGYYRQLERLNTKQPQWAVMVAACLHAQGLSQEVGPLVTAAHSLWPSNVLA